MYVTSRHFWQASLAVLFFAAICPVWGIKDALKAAEISREIRETFRRSGMNWHSPKMLKEVIDLKINTKPIAYFFTQSSCSNCRRLLSEFESMHHTMLSQLSAQFLTVLVLDDYNYDFGPEYGPDGSTEVPRMLFADPSGKLRYDLKNPKADMDMPYMYDTAQEVVDQLRRVLALYQEQPLPTARRSLYSGGSGSARSVRDYVADLTQDLPS